MPVAEKRYSKPDDAKYLLFVNPKSGRARRGQELRTLLDAAANNPDLRVHLIRKSDNIHYLVKYAMQEGVEAIGVAGGDGTVNAVASAVVGTKIPLVVIPFGTLNHFARDLGVAGSAEEALNLFVEGSDKTIDVGVVNDHYFLNNSSVGLYPSLVKQREQHEQKLGKWLAYGLAAWKVLRQPWLLHVKFDIDGHTRDIKTGIIFFANNQVSTSPLEAGHRSRLDGQLLDTFVVKASSLYQLIRVAASFLRNKLDQSPLVTRTEVYEATVYTSRQYIRVACDGEVYNLKSPLNYKVLSRALTMRVPEESEGKIEQENAQLASREEAKTA
jgi:diacylglycerol kinase family enzyme